MNKAHARLALPEPPDVSMYLNTDLTGENISVVFPKELQAVDELLILCDSSAIAPREDGINANLALLVAKPKQSTFQLYPKTGSIPANWILAINGLPELFAIRKLIEYTARDSG